MAAPGARLGGVRLRVLQRVRVEASVVHPADVRAARPRGRRPAAAAGPARRSPGRRCRAQSSSASSRWDCSSATTASSRVLPTGRSRWRSSKRTGRGSRPRSSSRRSARVAAVVAFGGDARRRRRRWAASGRTPSLALSTLVAVVLAVAGFDAFSPTRSTSAILRAAQAAAPFSPAAPVYQIAMYDQTASLLPRPHDDAGRLPGRARPRDRRRARAPDPERSRHGSTQWRAARRGVRRAAAGRLRAACGRRRSDARSRARYAPRHREPEIRCVDRLRLADDGRAAERRRPAAAEGGHQRARRPDAVARHVARHADANGDARPLRSRRRVLRAVALRLDPRPVAGAGLDRLSAAFRSATSSTRSRRTTSSARTSRRRAGSASASSSSASGWSRRADRRFHR